MSRYEARLLELQLAAEECQTAEDRALILGELAALKEACETCRVPGVTEPW